jgi:transposase
MVYFVGIDVSKSTLDIAVVKAGALIKEEQISNEKGSLKGFLKGLEQSFNLSFEEVVVCMEHTGIYNYRALEVLHHRKIKVCLEPAMQIKQSQGMTRGKDDKVDARRIAQYAYKNREQLVFWKPQREVFQKLQALLTVRERLIKAKKQLQVPLQESVDFVKASIVKSMKASSQPIIKAITKQLKELDSKIHAAVQLDQEIKKQYGYATSVPGVGPITALNVIIRTDGFERIKKAKQFACYAGVAPFKHQSGSSIRGRTRVSKLANMTIKTLLSLGAASAIQFNDEMKLYYQRKLADGKNKMSVINAVRNKLISRIFACVNEQRNYKKEYQYVFVKS